MRAAYESAGERVDLDCTPQWLWRVLEPGLAGRAGRDGLDGLDTTAGPDVTVKVESVREPFDTAGWQVLTRGAWQRPGQVVIANACSSGLDLQVTTTGRTLEVVARWRPPPSGRAASAVLRARSALLLRAVLLQYPALWWSQQRGRVPLHASVFTAGYSGGPTVLIAGPGGIGKSTLVNAELAAGASATSDNVCVSDGRSTWGLLEPRRVADGEEGGDGRRMPHGRREAGWLDRADRLTPDLVVVLRRGTSSAGATTTRTCPPAQAARSLAAGTYMAGELRRYWSFAATLAAGTDLGPTHPAVELVALELTSRLPCLEVLLGERPTPSLESLLAGANQTAAH